MLGRFKNELLMIRETGIELKPLPIILTYLTCMLQRKAMQNHCTDSTADFSENSEGGKWKSK